MTCLRRVLAVVLAAGGLLAACAPEAGEARPPEISYAQDMCEACGMIIDEARFAAATLTTDGQAHKFDDIGDMLAYHQAHPEEAVRAWFVHDYKTEAWVRGETAFYVVSPQIDSPMGHGIAAFAEQARAETFSLERGARVFAFDDLQGEISRAARGH